MLMCKACGKPLALRDEVLLQVRKGRYVTAESFDDLGYTTAFVHKVLSEMSLEGVLVRVSHGRYKAP
jgi:predicted transcriptional regulator of viral defense system